MINPLLSDAATSAFERALLALDRPAARAQLMAPDQAGQSMLRVGRRVRRALAGLHEWPHLRGAGG